MIHPPDGRKKRNMSNAGYVKTPTYKVWVGIRLRCRTTTKHGSTKSYAGIKISESWSEEFENFLNDMGERPSKQLSVDRKDNSKGYCKHNCKWATRYEQNINKRTSTGASVSQGIRLRRGLYEVRICVLGRMLHVGTYKTKGRAKADYDKFSQYFKPSLTEKL